MMQFKAPVRTKTNRFKKILLFALIFGLSIGSIGLTVQQYRQAQTAKTKAFALISAASIDQSRVSIGPDKVAYNSSEDKSLQSKLTVDGQQDSTGQFPYQVELPKKAQEGTTFADAKGELPFKAVPLTSLATGEYADGHMTYGQNPKVSHVITLKKNGIKEDILLSEAGEDSFSFSWRLELGSKLTAKLMADGSVGIFSASPYLYGNLQIADDKSRELVEKARNSENKSYLVYSLPKPYIVESGNQQVNYADVSYSLNGDVLTLSAKNMMAKKYPLSIDPSTVVVTSTSDFGSGKDDGGVNYSVPGQISRGQGVGSVSPITTSGYYFNFPRYAHQTVAYKGFLYVVGGYQLNADSNCKDTGESTNLCNDTQYAPINSDGSIGVWATSSNYFAVPRSGHSSFAYNGYLYVVGGQQANATTTCKDAGSSTRCNDIQRAVINADGSIGSWTTNPSPNFLYARTNHATVVYNGFLYVIGGSKATADTNCKNNGQSNNYCNDTQYAPINADGSVGTFTTNANYFAYPRQNLGAAAYNGYLYLTAGYQANSDTNCKNSGTDNYCNDVQYAAIAADGSVGSFTTSSNYIYTRRYAHTTFAYGGYLYVTAGYQVTNDTQCKNSSYGARTYCQDIQFTVITPNGNVGVWTTTYRTQDSVSGTGDYLATPRGQHATAIYNGYLYATGGYQSDSDTNCKNSGTNQYCNDTNYFKFNLGSPSQLYNTSYPLVSGWTTNSNYFTTPRYRHTSVAYNGYLYVIGGYQVNNDNACKNSGTSNYCNDVYYAPINANGTIGTWATTSYFSVPRALFAAVAYNGYLYVIGGQQANSDTACKNSGTSDKCNDVQYAQINANGTLGTFSNTSYFTYPRSALAAVAANNGYLYIIGGQKSTADTTSTCKNLPIATNYCNDIQYAQINANGTLGSFTTSPNYFSVPRGWHGAASYGSYLYLVGGYQWNSDTNCKDGGTNNYCNDVQYTKLNTDGSTSTWSLNPNYIQFPRYDHTVTISNGVIYVVSGQIAASSTNCKNGGNNIYCNDIQHAQLRPDGGTGVFYPSTNYISIARLGPKIAVYGSYIYMTGGFELASDTNCKNSGTNQYCNDTQYAFLNLPSKKATYEKIIDLGSSVSLVNNLTFNGSSACGVSLSYATAPSSGVFGSATTQSPAYPGTAYSINATSKRYVFVKIAMNDDACNDASTITDITVSYTQTPAAPTLTAPSSGATGVSRTPAFTFRTSDADSDYLQYRLYLYASDCSTPIGASPFAQASSQTGWSGQDRENFTAYVGAPDISNSTLATYTYQGTLSYNTQYCWKVDAIDPGGSNAYSSASSTRLFTTLANTSPAAPTLTQPLDTQTGTVKAPQFRLSSSDADTDYLKYKIEVCSVSNCSSIVRTIDQTSSQTGWLGQSLQTGTAYASGQLAAHEYQTPELTANTQYWWRAYAIDPGGTNTFSSASSIFTFTTGAGVGDAGYNGGVIIGQ